MMNYSSTSTCEFRKISLLFYMILMTTLGNLQGQQVTGISCGSYLQEIKTEIQLPLGTSKDVLRLFKMPAGIAVATSNGVFTLINGKWSGNPVAANFRTAAIDLSGKIWLATTSDVYREGDQLKDGLTACTARDTILCLCWANKDTLIAGTTDGLLIYDGKWKQEPFTDGMRINDVIQDSHNDIWAATNDGLLKLSNGQWINMDDNIMAYGLKRKYFSLENGSGNVGLLFGGLFALGFIGDNGEHWLLRGADGLPYGPVTTIRASGETIWLGTKRGAIRRDKGWRYYNGRRWLPDNRVTDILPLDDNTVWIATPAGISQISQKEMTLADKAEDFEKRIKARHDRYGLVSDSRLTVRGDLSTSRTVTNDNDGLWTSIYLASECFRYAVTKDPEAKKNAVRAFEAMEKLETITGIPGFPARSYVAANESTGEGGEWHLTSDGKWKWKGDTSSDEIVGHMLAYPLFYDLVAEGEYKERARNLVHRIMNYIVTNNFLLLDIDGKPTRWGVWTPDSLNNSINWSYERGINSLQILSFLKAAFHVTGDIKFEKAYETLVSEYHYDQNMIQQKMYGPFDVNHSDDELAFLPYYILFRYADEPELMPVYRKSLERSWMVEKPDRIPIWNIIASASLKKDCGLEVALEELQLIPEDMITWKMENSHRWDLQEDQLTDRFGYRQSVRPIPTPERGISKWNSNTYIYDSGSDGYSEDDGAYFLFPYWMGRYHGLLIEK